MFVNDVILGVMEFSLTRIKKSVSNCCFLLLCATAVLHAQHQHRNGPSRAQGSRVFTENIDRKIPANTAKPVSYTHLRAHETVLDLVCRLLL